MECKTDSYGYRQNSIGLYLWNWLFGTESGEANIFPLACVLEDTIYIFFTVSLPSNCINNYCTDGNE